MVVQEMKKSLKGMITEVQQLERSRFKYIIVKEFASKLTYIFQVAAYNVRKVYFNKVNAHEEKKHPYDDEEAEK